jgi:hypothetical protein
MEFPDAGELQAWLSGVRDHASEFPTGAHVEWIGAPHFFARGTLLVVCITGARTGPWPEEYRRPDDDQRTLDALTSLLGGQVAGLDTIAVN